MKRRQPRLKRTETHFTYTTHFRSEEGQPSCPSWTGSSFRLLQGVSCERHLPLFSSFPILVRENSGQFPNCVAQRGQWLKRTCKLGNTFAKRAVDLTNTYVEVRGVDACRVSDLSTEERRVGRERLGSVGLRRSPTHQKK